MDVFLNLLTSHKRITEAILDSYFDYFSNIFEDTCNAPGPILEEQSATLPTADPTPLQMALKHKSGGRIAARFVFGLGNSPFLHPLNRTDEQMLADGK